MLSAGRLTAHRGVVSRISRVGTSSTGGCAEPVRSNRSEIFFRDQRSFDGPLGRANKKGFRLYPCRVALDSMYAAPTTSISELPGIHDSAKHERGGAPYFVSAQNPL